MAFIILFDKKLLALLCLFVYCNAWTSRTTKTTSTTTTINNRLVVLGNHHGSSPEVMNTADDVKSNTTSSSTASLYLFSLQWTPDYCISKPVRDLWKWKDASLGDGRDFFVPKPKTITALQNYCQTNANLQECSILSNCARLEILCRATHNPVEELSSCFATQLKGMNNNRNSLSWQNVLTQKMDWPDLVINSEIAATESEESRELSRYWDQKEGMEDIAHHLSLVAAGIASRPRRPERETLFQPFSSRDAHILLQLKRTKEIAKGGTINKIWEYALRAGKAARNTEIVPDIEQLRSYSQLSSEAPKDLSREVAQIAVEKAITPLVEECLETAHAQEASRDIARVRCEAEALATNPSELKVIRTMLHQPTMDMRKGLPLDERSLIRDIKQELAAMDA